MLPRSAQSRFLLAASTAALGVRVGPLMAGRDALFGRVWLYLIGGAGPIAGIGLLAGGGFGGLDLYWPNPSARHPFAVARAGVALPAKLALVPQREVGTRDFGAAADWTAQDRAPQMLRFAVGRAYAGSAQAALRHATFAAPMRGLPPSPPPAGTATPAREPAASRWTASTYLFVRQGTGAPGLARTGQLGGSQAAARLTYRLGDGPVRIDIAGRAYRPLTGKGGEAALGLDWHPIAGNALRVSIERRIAIDKAGRDAWSAYAAGGLYAEPMRNFALDLYAQSGIVGVRSRDAFADGAVRAGYRLGPATIGAGVWGAAQPHVSRLDAGPRIALAMPAGEGTLSLALEGRFRLAGRADPGSGVTLTIAADF
jgi:hypothetical protein